ncbi:hypothetical protein POG22_20795 [Geitlerinema sp. CS-897]|nr:hypothetical protein [Geitlerinema sp. CS-897]
MKLFVEGWRYISQSYAVVNQFQLLELLTRSHVNLFHREMPYQDLSQYSAYTAKRLGGGEAAVS